MYWAFALVSIPWLMHKQEGLKFNTKDLQVSSYLVSSSTGQRRSGGSSSGRRAWAWAAAGGTPCGSPGHRSRKIASGRPGVQKVKGLNPSSGLKSAGACTKK